MPNIRKKKFLRKSSTLPHEDHKLDYYNKASPFTWLPGELLEVIFRSLDRTSLIAASRVCSFWKFYGDRAWLPKIESLLSHHQYRKDQVEYKYKKSDEDTRSFQQIYQDEYKKDQLHTASMNLVAIIMSQQKLFAESNISGDSFAALVLQKLNLLSKLITNINKSIKPYAMIQFLLNKIPDVPHIKCILEKGYMSNSNDPEIVRYKDNVSQTPRFNLTQILISLDDDESIKLLRASGININFSYYQVTPIMLATWYNCGKAFTALKMADSALYRQGSIDPSFEEPTLEFVAASQSYKILPFLDITPESFDQSLSNKPRPGYSNSKEFIERLLNYFESMLREFYIPMIQTLNKQELKHPLCVSFAHFAVNLEQTNNDVTLANELAKKEITQVEYDVMETIKYFIKEKWPIPEWLDEMLDILELRLTNENEWKTDVWLEDAAEEVKTLKM